MTSSAAMAFPVRGCARCGEDHDEVCFRPLRFPVSIGDVSLTHWAPCPSIGEPILLRIVTLPAEEQAAADAEADVDVTGDDAFGV
jgi:hypothetical protein